MDMIGNVDNDLHLVKNALIERSQNNINSSNNELRELERVERVLASKVAFLEKSQNDFFKVEEEYENVEQQMKSSDRNQCKLIGTVIAPALKAKQKMINQLEEMENGEVDTVCDFEMQLEQRAQSCLKMLKDYNNEQQQTVEQEKKFEVRRAQAKSEELDNIIRQMGSNFGLVAKNTVLGLEPHFLPRSPMALKMASIKNMAEVIRSTDELTAKINSALDPDLDERLAALQAELLSLQVVDGDHFNGQFSDLV